MTGDRLMMTVLFDGDCVLCSPRLGFVPRHERWPATQFASTGNPWGQPMARVHGIDHEALDLSYVASCGDAAYPSRTPSWRCSQACARCGADCVCWSR